ncbi:multiple epidermal growth factor-like domains protein 6 [Uloborus diversus]|uniref:multiple epidermal growth factor-like domains protein 6 n=1 Tax=Uloborus diversus TaxID=327109 RepID=UPI0024094571|nr:multiple epidermal growth factor-like domains protein 6 [Uloborus diversus]
MTCEQGRWSPTQTFPVCVSSGLCELSLTGEGSGSYNCTMEMNGKKCDVVCDGKRQGRYFCYPGRQWEPRLPHCVQAKGDATVINADRRRCQCQNGGTCDAYGRCVCLAGWSGVKCEQSNSHCKLVLTGHSNGSYDCTTEMNGTVCEVQCNGRKRGYFYCYPDSDWQPRLPDCVKVKEDAASNRIRCQCQNGGYCDADGRCVCPAGRSGTKCEKGGPAIIDDNLTRCQCQNGGICDNDERCLCPDGWSGTYCEKVSCADPGPLANADSVNMFGASASSRTNYRPGEIVYFSCNPGFGLQGSAYITCQTSGSWTEKPTCVQLTRAAPTTSPSPADSDSVSLDCPDPGSIANGIRKSYPPLNDQQRGYQRGSRVTYSCKEGYQLQGVESIFCLIGGEWSSTKPECDQVPRSDDETVIHAYDGPCQCQNGGYCESPGRCVCPSGWSGIYCENAEELGDLYCLDPGVVENAQRESYPPVSARQRGYLQGTRMTYTCKEGYHLLGAQSIFCLVGGEWSSSRPTCDPIPRAEEEAGILVYDVQCECQNGGQCDSAGRCICPAGWSGTYCEKRALDGGSLYCLDPGAVANAERTSIPPLSSRQRGFLQGSRVTYTCREGHQLQGDASMFCLDNGEWSTTKPKCEPIHTVQETHIPAS